MLKKMPDEYKGKTIYSPAYTRSDGTNNGSRLWTKDEEDWVMNLVDEGYTLPKIAESVDREKHSVSMKVKRLKKKRGDYNRKHIQEKYDSNDEFLNLINPETVLDCFCGINRYWKNKVIKTIDNDINDKIDADYNIDANELMDKLLTDGYKFDIVDIDPFGSAFDFIDNAYNLSTKGLIITLGEMGNKRWKRLDYVSKTYGIDNLDDYTSMTMANWITDKYSDLKLYKVDDFQNISRLYFVKGDQSCGGEVLPMDKNIC